ncbi:MAG: lipoprotein [Nanoarchaeota archaeon]|nr:lipoprotein [Nanoarchaeota archaeon]
MKKILFILVLVVLVSGCAKYKSFTECEEDCIKRDFEEGKCKWPEEIPPPGLLYSKSEIEGKCKVPNSVHCGGGSCVCHCYTEAFFESDESCTSTCLAEGFDGGGCMGLDERNSKFTLLAESYNISREGENEEMINFTVSNFPPRGKCGTDYSIACMCYNDVLGVLEK